VISGAHVEEENKQKCVKRRPIDKYMMTESILTGPLERRPRLFEKTVPSPAALDTH
jgi:hypothetical protein